MAAKNALTRTQLKLERLELEHLRQLAATLYEQLEQARADLEYASSSADFWQQHTTRLQESLGDTDFATHRAIGITKDGSTMVVALQ